MAVFMLNTFNCLESSPLQYVLKIKYCTGWLLTSGHLFHCFFLFCLLFPFLLATAHGCLCEKLSALASALSSVVARSSSYRGTWLWFSLLQKQSAVPSWACLIFKVMCRVHMVQPHYFSKLTSCQCNFSS